MRMRLRNAFYFITHLYENEGGFSNSQVVRKTFHIQLPSETTINYQCTNYLSNLHIYNKQLNKFTLH